MARLAAALAWLAAATVPVAGGNPITATLTGEARTPTTTRVATLRLVCQPARDGALELQLEILDAQTITDFDVAPFEGPDAPAAWSASSTIAVSDGGSGRREVRRAAAGWYSAEDPNAFVLDVSERSHHGGNLEALVGAIDERTRRITWTQHGHPRGSQTLEATFALDAGQAQRLRDAAVPCLRHAPH
jgi:hypothetical protein